MDFIAQDHINVSMTFLIELVLDVQVIYLLEQFQNIFMELRVIEIRRVLVKAECLEQ